MRLVISGMLVGTTGLVVSSYLGTGAQLASVTLASLLGALLAIHIVRAAHFEHLQFKTVLALALTAHLVALLGTPILEDDHYRYLWDAFRFAHDGTPYGAAPAAFFDDATVPPLFQNLLNFINYPDIPTIYGPVLQVLFLIGYLIAPGKVAALQGLNLLVSLATLVLLARCGAKPRWLLLYAISPLVLKEAVITAHPDALTGFLALAAFAVGGRRLPWIAGLLLGLAVASKVSVALLVPFLWVRGGARAVAATGITLVACYLPFLILSGSDIPTLSQFAQNWRFNPLLYAVLEQFTGPSAGRLLAGIAIMVIAIGLYWRDARYGVTRPKIPPADAVLGTLLLFSPVVNPWYLLWLLPFAVLRPSRTVWAATFLLPLSYWNGTHWAALNSHAFDLPMAVTLVEIAVLASAALLDRARPLPSERISKLSPSSATRRATPAEML